MVNIKSDFQLLAALNTHFVNQISTSVINQLQSLKDECYLQFGDDSGLQNVWEEYCVQVQGEETMIMNIHEDMIADYAMDEIKKLPIEVQILLSYMGSKSGDYELPENENPYILCEDWIIKEISSNIWRKAADYESQNITSYLTGLYEEEEEEEEEDPDHDDDDDVDEWTPYMDPENAELSVNILEYINKRLSSYIKGNHIKYGRAMFTVDMLIEESIQTYKINPDKDIYYIVDYMFDYFCT